MEVHLCDSYLGPDGHIYTTNYVVFIMLTIIVWLFYTSKSM